MDHWEGEEDDSNSESTDSSYFSADEALMETPQSPSHPSGAMGGNNLRFDVSMTEPMVQEDQTGPTGHDTLRDADSATLTVQDKLLASDQDGSPSIQLFQGASNFQISYSQINVAGGDLYITNYSNDSFLSGLACAEGAGIDTTKACMEGTRTEILDEIARWVNAPGANVPRLLWLSGPAGTGKSAIAHTIARWWTSNPKNLGSCFCFSRQAKTRYERVFTTIARDLAARCPDLKNILASVVGGEPSLSTTVDITQQWRKLILEPVSNLPAAVLGTIFVVIDALDESGEAATRRHILSVLAGAAIALPLNVRILVTSRPLPDIRKAFYEAPGVISKSMDEISPFSTERDIRFYISHQLRDAEDEFDDEEIAQLAQKSDSLFEWARLACEYIKYSRGFLSEKERYDELLSRAEGEAKELLDDLYRIILRDIMGERPNGSTLFRFRSVMRFVLSALEPLPMRSLDAMHRSLLAERQYFDVAAVLRHMGPLLSGVSDHSMPIRPLHSSFPDFLTTLDRGGGFFIDLTGIDADLGQACLRIMHAELRFNICKLESSYMRNSEIKDLEHRVKNCITPHLSYSCRFWVNHIKMTIFEPVLASSIQGILLHERMLFWLEALALLKVVNVVPDMLATIAKWLEEHDLQDAAIAAAKDGIRFVRMAGGTISESTPHLYLSGLPWLPKNSILSRYQGQKFLKLPRIALGQPLHWHAVQFSISGHASSVMCVSFSPDGKRILSCSSDRTICIWDSETGLLVGNPLKGHSDPIFSIAMSPDGTKIVSGSLNSIIFIWNAETGSQVAGPLKGHTGLVWEVAFSPDGKWVVSGSDDGNICLWDAKTGLQMGSYLKGHDGPVYSVAFSPDGRRIASGGDDQKICIWDIESRVQIGKPLNWHTGLVRAVTFSPDGKKIASGSSDCRICICNAETGLQICSPLEGHTGQVWSVSFSPDGKRLCSGSDDETVCIWDTETGVLLGTPLKEHTEPILSVAFSPDGEKIVSGSHDSTICIWDVETSLQMGSTLRQYDFSALSVVFTPDGKSIITGCNDKMIYIWDAETGSLVGDPLRGHDDWVRAIACSVNGERIVSCSDDGTVCIWDIKTGLQVGPPLRGHDGPVLSVAFSPNGRKIVSCSSDSSLCIWDVETGLQVGDSLMKHELLVWSVSFSPDGRKIASGSDDKTICIWDSETGLQIGKPLKGHTGPVFSVAFSPDGKRLASGSYDKTVCIWDAETGSQIRSPLHHAGVIWAVAFSPGGMKIASGGNDHVIYVWDVETGLMISSPLTGHTATIFSLAFSPDGRRIVSGSGDKTICVWDIEAEPSIKFSATAGHALCNATSIFSGTPELKEDWRNHISLDNNGWIVGSQGQLLMWVPPANRIPFYSPWMHDNSKEGS